MHLKTNVLHSQTYLDLPLSMRTSIMAEITKLIHAPTEKDFDERLATCRIIWEKECLNFLKYFQKHILNDLRNSSKYNAEPFGVFYPVGGVSNNASESMNSLFKSLIGNQRNMAISGAMKKSILLTRAKLNRNKYAVQDQFGEYVVDHKFTEQARKLKFPLVVEQIADKQLNSMFDEGLFNEAIEQNVISDIGRSFSKSIDGIASWIAMNPSRLQFTQSEDIRVLGIEGAAHYVNPKTGKCTCHHPGRCEHKIALELKGIPSQNRILRVNNVAKKIRRNLTKLNQAAVSKRVGKKIGARMHQRNKYFQTIAPKKRTVPSLRRAGESEVMITEPNDDQVRSNPESNQSNISPENLAAENSEVEAQQNDHNRNANTLCDIDQRESSSVEQLSVNGQCIVQKATHCVPSQLLSENNDVEIMCEQLDSNDAKVASTSSENIPVTLKRNRRKSPVKTKLDCFSSLAKTPVHTASTSGTRGRSMKKGYCYCGGPDDGKFMICCEVCQNWFHGRCLQWTQRKMKAWKANKNEIWICDGCEEK